MSPSSARARLAAARSPPPGRRRPGGHSPAPALLAAEQSVERLPGPSQGGRSATQPRPALAAEGKGRRSHAAPRGPASRSSQWGGRRGPPGLRCHRLTKLAQGCRRSPGNSADAPVDIAGILGDRKRLPGASAYAVWLWAAGLVRCDGRPPGRCAMSAPVRSRTSEGDTPGASSTRDRPSEVTSRTARSVMIR